MLSKHAAEASIQAALTLARGLVTDSRSTIHHFGPDPHQVGGMETVISVIEEERIGGDHVVVHPTWSARGRFGSVHLGFKGMRDMLKLPRGSIVHIHLSEGASFIREGAVLRAASIRGYPTVTSIHGAEFIPFARHHPRLVRGVLERADAITCLSSEVESVVRQLVPNCDIEVVPNPAPAADHHVAASETAPLVLFAGERGVRKGADVLAAAWPAVRSAVPDAHCLMLGPATRLEIAKQPGLEVRGPVDRHAIADLLTSARVVALPSRAEGMPMVLTEALAAGRPFVSTPVGGIPALAHSPGMLVPIGDSEALAAALVAYLSDPMLATSVGEAGRKFWRGTRSPTAVDRRLRAVYSRAAA